MNKIDIMIYLMVFNIMKNCPGTDEYCASCLGSTCSYCYASYLGQNGKCLAPTVEDENCLTFSSQSVCKKCVYGYNLVNGKCVSISIENCVVLKNETECEICSEGIKVVNGLCKEENECSIENCKYCGMDGVTEICILCDGGYALYAESSAS